MHLNLIKMKQRGLTNKFIKEINNIVDQNRLNLLHRKVYSQML